MRRSAVGRPARGSSSLSAIPGEFCFGGCRESRAAPSIGKQLAELKGSDTLTGDALGVSAAISGTTALVEHRAPRKMPAGVRVH